VCDSHLSKKLLCSSDKCSKWSNSRVSLGIFDDLFYKLLMEKLQLCALMPFMFCMPYFTPFCAGKYKQRSRIAKVHKKFAISEYFADSEITPGRFGHWRSFGEVQEAELKKFAISEYFADSENCPGSIRHWWSFSEIKEIQQDKGHVEPPHWGRGRFPAFR